MSQKRDMGHPEWWCPVGFVVGRVLYPTSQKRDMGHPALWWFGRLWWRLDLGGAAVYEELDAVDVAGVAGGEEEGDGGDLFGASDLSAGDLGFEVLFGVGTEGVEDGGVDGAGAEDVDAD